ncbi:hypothetical protein GCM10020331_074620 [Ectobacillus funiculus]
MDDSRKKMVKGMGGAMDLVNGAKTSCCHYGACQQAWRIQDQKECTLPLTGKQVVHRLITDLAVFDFTAAGMVLVETQEGITVEEVQEKNGSILYCFTRIVTSKLIDRHSKLALDSMQWKQRSI